MTQNTTTGKIWDVLTEVVDPELGVDVVNLGLIYDLDVNRRGKVTILMTLTSIGCPFAAELETAVKEAVGELEGVREVNIAWSFDPPWSADQITEDGRDQLLALGYL